MAKRKILILGASSYVGRHLFSQLCSENTIGTYNSNPVDNGVMFDSVSMSLHEIIKVPEEISHAILLLGDTHPGSCASDVNRSQEINVESIQRVIDCFNKWGIKPIFTSTEYVFDGSKGNYTEKDRTNPVLTYGKQKLAVEKYLEKQCDYYTILRLSKVIGATPGDGTLFSNWLDAIEKTKSIKCAQDQVFSPVLVDDVVESIIRVIDDDINGLFHLSGGKAFSRLTLLEMLLETINCYTSENVGVEVIPCSIHDFPLMERNPENVSMDSTKLSQTIGITFCTPESVCERVVEQKFQKEEAL